MNPLAVVVYNKSDVEFSLYWPAIVCAKYFTPPHKPGTLISRGLPLIKTHERIFIYY